jgi:hypothetical protein
MIERPEREPSPRAEPRVTYVITGTRAARPARLSWRARWRGLCAVAALLLSAAAALASAVLGVPPAAVWRLSGVGPAVGDAYRHGARGCPVVILAPPPPDAGRPAGPSGKGGA